MSPSQVMEKSRLRSFKPGPALRIALDPGLTVSPDGNPIHMVILPRC